MTVQLKRNDTKDVISFTITNLDGTTVNLTGATVKFVMGKKNTLITYADATIKDAANGKVEYSLTDADTLQAGTFQAEFEVTFSDGKVKSFPSNGYLLINIQANIDNTKSTYIADQIANRVSDLQVWKDQIQAQLNNFAAGDSGAEAAQARVDSTGKTYTTLKQRLDNQDSQIKSNTTSLADMTTNKLPLKADKTYADTELAKKRDKATSIMLADLHTEVKTAMTGGSVAVVGINSTGTENIKNLAVTPEKTSFIDNISINLFDKRVYTDGKYIDPSSGALVSDVNFVVTDYIAVTSGQQYATNMSYGAPVAFYDANKVFIRGYQVNPATSPANAAFVRWSVDKTNTTLDTFMIVKGSTTPNVYMPYGVYKLGSSVQIPIIQTTDVSFIKSESVNLFDKTKITNDGYYIDKNGTFTPYAGFCVSDFIPVNPNETYITSHTYAPPFAIYDANKVIINGVNQTNPVTMPSNAAFVRWSVDKTNTTLDTFMIVKGSTLPNSYIPYSLKSVLNNVFIYRNQILDLQSTWAGKKVDVLGDSITAMNLWQPTVASKLGTQTFSNHGVSGSCISGTAPDAMWTDSRVNALTTNSDLYLIMGGTNDWANNTPLESGNKKDTNTFKGAYRVLLEKLIAKFPTKYLAIMTTPFGKVPNRAGWTDQTGIINNNGFSTRDYAKACREVAGEYGIPVIDIDGETYFNTINLTQFVTDEGNMIVHPNATGAKRMAEIVVGKLKQIEPI